MTEPLLECVALSRAFEMEGSRIEVLDQVNFALAAGEMVSLTGASGAGKSTLLHLLGTLDLPDAGELRFEGRELTGLDSDALAAHRNAAS